MFEFFCRLFLPGFDVDVFSGIHAHGFRFDGNSFSSNLNKNMKYEFNCYILDIYVIIKFQFMYLDQFWLINKIITCTFFNKKRREPNLPDQVRHRIVWGDLYRLDWRFCWSPFHWLTNSRSFRPAQTRELERRKESGRNPEDDKHFYLGCFYYGIFQFTVDNLKYNLSYNFTKPCL